MENMKMNLVDVLYTLKDHEEFQVSNDFNNFFNFCVPLLKRTKSQSFQDLFVLYEYGTMNEGYFVDFGAYDGVQDSNTYLLEKEYGWKGLCVEPNQELFNSLWNNRKCLIGTSCVYDKTGEELPFTIIEDSKVLSTLNEFIHADYNSGLRNVSNKRIEKVLTVTLYDLLEQNSSPRDIDYISVDTEGSELRILRKFFEENHNKYKVKLWTIEHNYNDGVRKAIHDLMTSQGYERVLVEYSRWDDFYKRSDY